MDYLILKSRIALKGINVEQLADKMKANGAEISTSQLYLKIRGKYEFDRNEIAAIKEVLNLTDKEVIDIFFDGNE